MVVDMTKGNPLRLILMFSFPLIIGNIFQQLYAVVDTIIVGRYVGPNALAGVGTTGAIFSLTNSMVIGMASGFSIMVAQKYGAKDNNGVKLAVGSNIILTLMTTIIITILMLILIHPLLRFMNTPEEIYYYAQSYITIIVAGIFTQAFYNTAAGILRAIGDSRTPIYFLVLACILNIILDLVFIIKFDMGVAGAGYATNVSQGIAALLCIIYSYKKFDVLKLTAKDFKVPKFYYEAHLKMGIPMSIQFSILSFGIISVQGVINSFGASAIAAYTAANKVILIMMQPIVTYGVAVATYVGQNKGALNFIRIKEGVRTAAIINIFTGIIIGIIMIVFGKEISSLFLDNPSVQMLEMTGMALNYAAYFYIPLGFIFVYRNALQSMNRPVMPMLSGAIELTTRVAIAYTLPKYIGFAGVCLADPLTWLITAIPLMWVYFIEIKKSLRLQGAENEN
ncbi:MAG: MATE family efflux transporter [Epulopiscium sp. Nuni2H_MBin003]|nr:MAG: MATE family efflux transporter [Epulopiscium sp. Nuni2H_MBin003]